MPPVRIQIQNPCRRVGIFSIAVGDLPRCFHEAVVKNTVVNMRFVCLRIRGAKAILSLFHVLLQLQQRRAKLSEIIAGKNTAMLYHIHSDLIQNFMFCLQVF
jgi:hypothetical protein